MSKPSELDELVISYLWKLYLNRLPKRLRKKVTKLVTTNDKFRKGKEEPTK